MQTVRVALAQIAPKLGDLKSNFEIHLDAVALARRKKAHVVVFPELSLTGYVLRDQVPEVALSREAPLFRKLLRASAQIDMVVGFAEETQGHRFHNAAAYLSKGRVLHIHRKIYLPTYGMFDEGRDFAAGDLVRAFETPRGPAGILICEDAWHPTCAWLLVQDGAEILIAPSSGPTRGAKPGRGITSLTVWHDLLRTTAQFQTSFVVYVNRVGYEDGLNFGGGSAALDPFGRIVASLPGLSEGMTVAELDVEVLRRARTAYPLLRDENLELVHREIARIRQERFQVPDPLDMVFLQEPAAPRRKAR
ncbi:MAG TPA: nitrilase-related carbon-nitrogen hydrolase [Candidatus Polarisedimenticolaceae bacterium]|nr:nitrilase-related carbon-nitrogen hydrolase [Candidatus Polarisedimenticolaceae bacterium]